MQTHASPSRLGGHSTLFVVVVTALALTLVSSICMVNPAKARAGGPTSAASAVAGLLSRTNYRSVPLGAFLDGYWYQPQSEAPDRVMYVGDPLGQRGTVQRIEVQPGDGSTAPKGGERTHVLNTGKLGGFKDGDTIVMSWGLMIDSTFASPSGTWNSFVAIHDGGSSAQAPLHLSLAGDQAHLVLALRGGGDWIPDGQPAGDVLETLDLGPLSKDRWHDFGLAVRFGCTGTGYVQLWVDRQHLVDARGRKIGYCGDPGMYWKQGFYRSAYDKRTRLWFSDTYRWASLPDADKYYRSRPASVR